MLRYLWEYHKNPAVCTLHVDAALPECPYMTEPKTEDAKAFRSRILAIPGVVSCSTGNRYQLSITRGLAFDWEPLQESVLASVREFLGSIADEFEAVGSGPIWPEAEPRKAGLGNLFLWS